MHFCDEIHENASVSNGTNEEGIPGTSSNTQDNVAASTDTMLNGVHERDEGSYHYINDVFRSAPKRNIEQFSASDTRTCTQVVEGNDANEGTKTNTFNSILNSAAADFLFAESWQNPKIQGVPK